jgi:hypothetical protein
MRARPTATIVRATALVKAGARRKIWLAEWATDLLAAESTWTGADRLVAAACVGTLVLLRPGDQVWRLLAVLRLAW